MVFKRKIADELWDAIRLYRTEKIAESYHYRLARTVVKYLWLTEKEPNHPFH